MPLDTGVQRVGVAEIGPSQDCDEFTFAAGELDVTSIGGYPVRLIEIVDAGTGTLKFKTSTSGATFRTASVLTAGDRIGPAQITSIGGTGDGTNVTKVRVYK